VIDDENDMTVMKYSSPHITTHNNGLVVFRFSWARQCIFGFSVIN